MMGRNGKPPSPLFYSISPDEVVPQDHFHERAIVCLTCLTGTSMGNARMLRSGLLQQS